LGRADNLINSGGVKIIPEEVEKRLRPFISSNFFIAGIPDQVLGMKVALFIEGAEKPDLKKVEFDSKYHRPKEVINLKMFLYSNSGKIRRQDTLRQYLDLTDY
jgi:O-succinylbenzoic acid--CoA ligase